MIREHVTIDIYLQVFSSVAPGKSDLSASYVKESYSLAHNINVFTLHKSSE